MEAKSWTYLTERRNFRSLRISFSAFRCKASKKRKQGQDKRCLISSISVIV
jgi:hypothetical protein